MADPTIAHRESPLHAAHLSAGAKMADFGGWLMPIEYAGGGVVAEHLSVRQNVGIFDVSHLGKATVTGIGAREFVNACLTNDLGRVGAGQAQYTLCCDESGGVVDDLIVYLRSDEDLFLVPNAANTAEVVRRLQAAAPAGVQVTDRHGDYGVIAVQGPRSPEVLEALGLPIAHSYMSFVEVPWGAGSVIVCRTGYTGEVGFELVPTWSDTVALWDALSEAVVSLGGRACGLGARDTLRTEMGYPLHGQDLSLDISPVQARAGWAVGWSKPTFWGRDALTAERAEGPTRQSWGLRVSGRGIPRAHCTVHRGADVTGELLGEVTSGTFSPSLKSGIALALLSGVAVGEQVCIDVRGRPAVAEVTRPPFLDVSVRD